MGGEAFPQNPPVKNADNFGRDKAG